MNGIVAAGGSLSRTQDFSLLFIYTRREDTVVGGLEAFLFIRLINKGDLGCLSRENYPRLFRPLTSFVSRQTNKAPGSVGQTCQCVPEPKEQEKSFAIGLSLLIQAFYSLQVCAL